MKLLILLLTLFVGISCYAQRLEDQRVLINNIVESNLKTNLSSDLSIKGDYFLQKDWQPGELYTKNRKKISDGFLFRYFVYTEEMHAIVNKKDTIILKSNLIDSICINKQKFIYLTYIKNTSFKNSFFEELTNGKFRLLKKYRCMFIEGNEKTSSGYEEGKPDSYIIMKDYYYQEKNHPAISLPSKKSELIQIFTNQDNNIAKFIKSNKLKLRKEKDLIKLFNYYNTLE